MSAKGHKRTLPDLFNHLVGASDKSVEAQDRRIVAVQMRVVKGCPAFLLTTLRVAILRRDRIAGNDPLHCRQRTHQ